MQNLLGYSNRKLKRYDLALAYYQKALELQPKHRGANNYVGHLYLETGRLEQARERLAVLDQACTFGCKEYSDLQQAIAGYPALRCGRAPGQLPGTTARSAPPVHCNEDASISDHHGFATLSGGVDASGKAWLRVDLASVESNIDKRNQRIREHLFEVEHYP